MDHKNGSTSAIATFFSQEEPSEEEKLGGKKTLRASQCQAKLPAGKNALGPGVEPQG